MPSEKDDRRSSVDIESLDVFALERWEVRTLTAMTCTFS